MIHPEECVTIIRLIVVRIRVYANRKATVRTKFTVTERIDTGIGACATRMNTVPIATQHITQRK